MSTRILFRNVNMHNIAIDLVSTVIGELFKWEFIFLLLVNAANKSQIRKVPVTAWAAVRTHLGALRPAA